MGLLAGVRFRPDVSGVRAYGRERCRLGNIPPLFIYLFIHATNLNTRIIAESAKSPLGLGRRYILYPSGYVRHHICRCICRNIFSLGE